MKYENQHFLTHLCLIYHYLIKIQIIFQLKIIYTINLLDEFSTHYITMYTQRIII
jgi:hypothetical protein